MDDFVSGQTKKGGSGGLALIKFRYTIDLGRQSEGESKRGEKGGGGKERMNKEKKRME
jgi:hypothetical protein